MKALYMLAILVSGIPSFSGWVELEKVDSPLESRCELNREKLGMPETRIASIYKTLLT
jgi:hypothetical protein